MKRFAPSSYHSQRQHLIDQISKRTTFFFAILCLQCSDCQIRNNKKRSDLDAIFKYTVKISATNITFVDPVVIYLLKGNNWNTRTRCEICSKLPIKTAEQRHRRRSGAFIVNLKHILLLALVFLLLTFNM